MKYVIRYVVKDGGYEYMEKYSASLVSLLKSLTGLAGVTVWTLAGLIVYKM